MGNLVRDVILSSTEGEFQNQWKEIMGMGCDFVIISCHFFEFNQRRFFALQPFCPSVFLGSFSVEGFLFFLLRAHAWFRGWYVENDDSMNKEWELCYLSMSCG